VGLMLKGRKLSGVAPGRRPLITSATAAIRRVKPGGRTNNTKSASILLSSAALIVSMGSMGVGILQTNAAQDQVQIAERQNQELRDQFAQAGPVIRVSSSVLFTEKTAIGTPVRNRLADSKVTIDATTLDSYQVVYFTVELANAGRSATTIQSVDLKTGPNAYFIGDHISTNLLYDSYAVYCGTTPIQAKNCLDELPYTLEPGNVYAVTFPILPEYYKSIVDNGVGSRGLETRIYAVGIQQQPLHYVSHVRVVK